ncbi:MAG TPA: pitrilysin family protein [Gemmatimonadaceae bacterium]|nr:pitrilysin family protein [Gemmatimonadaceae bacterium]
MTIPSIATRALRAAAIAGLAVGVARPASAQKLDRDKVPAPGAAPTTKIPSWSKSKLANGAELVVSVKKDLPLVSFNVGFVGGTTTYEPADKTGVASFTAQMLSEGTATKTADELSNAQQLLGINITANVTDETGVLGFTALKDRLQPAVELLADMMLHPRFPAEALERIRGRTLVNLQTGRDNPNLVASNVFKEVTYGADHPYGRFQTEATVKAITLDDIKAFHQAFYTPGHAVISVAGDVDPAAVKAMLDKAFAAWPAGGAKPDFKYPAPPPHKARTIYLVDKPKAAQSVFQLGETGPDRYTPDYYALEVMNTILGGLFQSRLNHDIREEKGYSYGVGSTFEYGRGPGAFRAGGGIVTAKSDSALILFMQHLRGVQGSEPFTDDELKQGKDALVQSLPQTFSSVAGVRSAISGIYLRDLPENYYQQYAARVNAVTKEDLVRVAKKYLDLDNMNLVIVGDRAAIEEALRKTGIAPIVHLDVNGRPVITP